MSDRTGEDGSEPIPSTRTQRLATVAAAVQATKAARALTDDLAALEIPVMVLRGPPVQLRLLGSDSAYRSADLDLLIAARHRRSTFQVLRRRGWQFTAENGVLWRLDRAAAFAYDSVTVDLHWGLHAFWVSPRHLRSLERALWSGAAHTSAGWYEPAIEPLLVYLAVHGAASGFQKPEALTLVNGAAELVTDWTAVEALARRVHLWSTVRYAVGRARGGAATPPPPVFDGVLRRVVGAASRRTRALSAVPAVRRAVLALRRSRRRPV